MSYGVLYSAEAEQALSRLPADLRELIRLRIEGYLAEEPLDRSVPAGPKVRGLVHEFFRQSGAVRYRITVHFHKVAGEDQIKINTIAAATDPGRS